MDNPPIDFQILVHEYLRDAGHRSPTLFLIFADEHAPEGAPGYRGYVRLRRDFLLRRYDFRCPGSLQS